MIPLLVVILVGIVLWYLVFIMFGDFWRQDRNPAGRSPKPVEPPTPNRGCAVDAPPLGWTALDDQQLTRLLKGAAP